MRGLVADSESTIIIGDVLIAIISTRPKAHLVTVTFVDERCLVMSRTVHVEF